MEEDEENRVSNNNTVFRLVVGRQQQRTTLAPKNATTSVSDHKSMSSASSFYIGHTSTGASTIRKTGKKDKSRKPKKKNSTMLKSS